MKKRQAECGLINNEGTSFVHLIQQLLLGMMAVLLLLCIAPSRALAGETYTVKVDKGYLALRREPSYNEANEIGELYTGEVVEVKDRSNGQYWWVYSPKHGKEGYVNADYLVGRGRKSGGTASSGKSSSS